MNLWVWEVCFIYLFFHSAEAQQSTARCFTGYSSVVRRTGFRHLCSSSCSIEFKHRLRKHPSGAGQLFICGSPQLAGVLRSILAFVTYLSFFQGYILLSSLPIRNLNKVMQCYGTSVRDLDLGQVKSEKHRQGI